MFQRTAERTTDRDADTVMVPCAVCDTVNSELQSFCHRCLTPLELTRSIVYRGAPARFISVLGASAAGKTVYLGFLLDILSKGIRGLRGLPNGSFSIAVQQQTMLALQNRQFPEKTPSEADSWRWVHCEVSRQQRRKSFVDIVTPDFAGEAIAQELDQPGTFHTIHSVVRKSAAVMILIDSLRVRDAGREEDFFAMKLASYIANLHGKNGTARKPLPLPISVIFTKADACPEARDNPATFAAANLPSLTHFCTRNFAKTGWFAAGVVGATATVMNDRGYYTRIPLHIEPHGIVEPLEWVIEQV